jgi:hypothetical protein
MIDGFTGEAFGNLADSTGGGRAFKPPVSRMPAARNIPSRFNLTYAFELVAVDAAPATVLGALGLGGAGANRVVNLPMQPNRYEVDEQPAQLITPTVGGVSVEESGFVLRQVTIAGTCGLKPKRGWSAGTPAAAGDLIYADGNTLWRELRSLFRLYAYFRANPAAAPAKYVMAFHDFVNDDHWIVVPTSFRSPREAAAWRLHYPYEIAFTAVADYDNASKNFFDDGILGEITGGLAKARALINKITGYVEDARAFVGAVNAAISGAILGTIGAVTNLLAAANDLKNGVRDFINLPKKIAAGIQSLIDQWHQLVEDQEAASPWSPASQVASERLAGLEVAGQMADALDGLLAADVWQRSWRETSDEQAVLQAGEANLTRAELTAVASRGQLGATTAAAARALAARATPGSASRLAGPPRRQGRNRRAYTGQRSYIIRGGDTLLSIAAREMGDPDAWMDLRDANALRYPYVTVLRLPGTVAPGDQIMIPTTAAAPGVTGTRGIDGSEPNEDQVLGVDMLLTDEGEWQIDPTGTDVLKVRGAACYEQDLRIKLETPLGTNMLYPHVGILTPIGQPNGRGLPQAVALSVRTAVIQDPRTASLGPLVVRDAGDGVAVEITAYPRGSRDGRVLKKAV